MGRKMGEWVVALKQIRTLPVSVTPNGKKRAATNLVPVPIGCGSAVVAVH